MKVTKTIREFIENQIRAKAEESVAELKKRADEASEAYIKDKQATTEKCQELTSALMEKYNINEAYRRSWYLPNENDLPESVAYNSARRKAFDKVPRIVTEIAATMELGGTKAELLEMINNVTF